jgi:hypothetical protein
VNRIVSILSFYDKSIEAYYRENRTMPDSLEVLDASGWVLFDALPTTAIPGLRIVGRALGSPEQDRDAIGIWFESSGYHFAAFEEIAPPGDEEEWKEYDWDQTEAVSRYERHYAGFTSTHQWTDSNPTNIRISLMLGLCDRWISEYWKQHGTLPSTVEELLNGAYAPREDAIRRLPVVPTDQFGWFYCGVEPHASVSYVEYMLTDLGANDSQKIFSADDPDTLIKPGLRMIGRYVRHGEEVTRDETVRLIDASLPGWGLLGAV